MKAKTGGDAYRRHYDHMRSVLSVFDDAVVGRRIQITLHVWDPEQLDHEAAKMDAATDVLMKRGMCADVTGWHKRPRDWFPDLSA